VYWLAPGPSEIENKFHGVKIMACPPRPETGTGSGGATLLEYTVGVTVFRK
jgi:hypothetical protein